MKKKVLEILSNHYQDEVNFDNDASSLIDDYAKKGRELPLLQAHTRLDEKLSKEKSKQSERYSAVVETIFSQNFPSIADEEKYYKSVFGIVDLDDLDFLNQYSFQVHDFRNLEYNPLGPEAVKKSIKNEEQCIVVIRNYNVICPDEKEKADSIKFFKDGEICYYNGNELIRTIFLDEKHPVHCYQKEKDACDLNDSEKLTLKKLTLKYLDTDLDFQNFTRSNQIMSQFAAKPDNFLILDYLIQFALNLNLPIERCVATAFEQAVRYSCTSNVYMMLHKYDSSYHFAYFFKFSDDFFDHNEILDEKQLKTDSKMVDILMLLYQSENIILNKFLTPFFEIIDNNPEEKISTKTYKKRQVVVLFAIYHYFKNSPQRTMSHAGFTDLINLLNDEILIWKFFELANVNLYYNPSPFQAFRCLSLSGQLFTSSYRALIFPKLTLEIQNLLKNNFPADITLLILGYIIPSIFDKARIRIEKIKRHKTFLPKVHFQIDMVKAPKQSADSSDCGYWSLFNACRVLSGITDFNSNINADSPKKIKLLENQFQSFKKIANEFLENKIGDLTAVDLDTFLKKASKIEKLSSLFPHLNQNLLSSQEALGIPVYSIINSSIAGDDQKLDPSYRFGGCLEMQMAINFYTLSKNEKINKNQPLYHLVLVGVGQHWHFQLLTLSYSNPGLKNLWIFDSGNTAFKTLRTIIAHFDDVFSNAENYAEGVADEVFPSIGIEVKQLSTLSHSYLEITEAQKDTFYDRCQLLIQFFDILGSLPMAKKFLPILESATKFAYFLLKNGDGQFENVSKDLSRLCRSQSEEPATLCFFSESTQTQSSSIPTQTHSSDQVKTGTVFRELNF